MTSLALKEISMRKIVGPMRTTSWTDKSMRPSLLYQVFPTLVFSRKHFLKFEEVNLIIHDLSQYSEHIDIKIYGELISKTTII